MKLSLVSGLGVRSTQLDAFTEELAYMQSRGHDTCLLIGNIVLQTSSRVNRQFNSFVDRTTKSTIILCRIEVIRIVFGVVYKDYTLG